MSLSQNGNSNGKIMKRMNRKSDSYIELSGWVGFAIGMLLASLLFIFILIPNAESSYDQEETCHSTVNTDSAQPS